MYKKITTLLLIMVLLFHLFACGKNEQRDSYTQSPLDLCYSNIHWTFDFLFLEKSITHDEAYDRMKGYRDTIYELEGPESEAYKHLSNICDGYADQDLLRVYEAMIDYVEYDNSDTIYNLASYPEDSNLTYSRNIEIYRGLLDAYEALATP